MIATEIVELTGPGPLLEAAYQDIMLRSFDDDELCSAADVEALAASGQRLVWAAVDPDGTVAGIAVGEWDAAPRVVLLSWIATRPGRRGGGIGGPLLDHVLECWRTAYDPCVILAEVEDPRRFPVDEDHGDPAARLRFYTRRGARILDVPYFQAALGPAKHRVPGLFLMVLYAHPSFAGQKPDTLRGDFLHQYLEIYQRVCEGAVGTDPDAVALYEAVDRAGGVPYMDPASW